MDFDFSYVTGLVLCAAFFHASWNALVKSGRDRLVMQAFVITVPGLVAVPFLFFLPLPAVESWPFMLTSTVIHAAYYWTLLSAYKTGDLSLVYPVARGSAPALVATGAWFIAGEHLNGYEIAGLVILTAGIISFARLPKIRKGGEHHGLIFAILTGLTIAGYSIADGLGARASGNAFSYIAWLFAIECLPLALFTWWQRRGRIKQVLSENWVKGLMGGTVGGLAYGIVMWAMTVVPMAHVIAIRETSVVLAAFIGAKMLKEPLGTYRIGAAILVTAGAVLLKLSGS